jgi:hypothetical protein
MLKHSIRLVIHYLKFWEVPVPYPSYHFNRALAEANRVAKTSLEPTYHTSIQQRRKRQRSLDFYFMVELHNLSPVTVAVQEYSDDRGLIAV